MKREIFSVLFALVLVLSFSLIPAVPAGAVKIPSDRVTAITNAADRLVALQGVDFGWDWSVTDATGHSGSPSSSNLYGVTALGLIDAYQVTDTQSYLTAAGLVADMMVGTANCTAFKAGFGQSFDLRFLMSYAEASDDTSYSDFAKAYWDWVKARDVESNVYADGSQEAFYQFYTQFSHGFAAWGTGDFGLAALAMGDTAWASAMATVVSTHLPEIAVDDINRFIGWGHALEFLNAVDPVTYSSQITGLITNLKTSQNADGSWGTGENPEGIAQDAAYAIMGLAAVGGVDAIAVARDGADWLVANQGYGSIIGGWNNSTGNIEYSETDSEALQALASVPAPVTIGEREYYSIQSAINSASPEDTINVARGTYNEYILIDRALTVRSTDGAEETIIDGSGFRYVVRIYSADVTFEGFTVTNPTYEGGADASGILIGAYLGEPVSNVRVLNNIVKEVRSGTSGTPSMYGATGINIGRRLLSNVVISGNTIENIKNPEGASIDHTCGINVWDGAEGVVISNNTISDIKYNGILLQYASNVQIENNPISGCETGIRVEPFEGATVSDLTVNLNNFGDNFIQLLDGAEALVIEDVLANNTFDRAVTVDHPEASLLYTIWSKIQDGIDAAVSGDTVNVAAGTYVEAITIGKPLTLRGATYNVNKNGYTVPADYAWDDTVESIINHPNPSGGYTTIVDIVDTNDVTFEGFVVQELDAVGNLNSSLLRVYAHTQEISNIAVRNNVIGPNTNTTAQDGTHGRMGLYIVNHPYSDNGVVNSTFSGNKIFDCKGDGNNVFVWSSYYAYGAPGLASMSGTVIEDNEIYGAHRSGIETAGGFSGLTIRNNKIYGNSGLATDDSDMLKYGHGILLIRGASDKLGGPDEALTPEDLTITGNEIYNNEKSGIYMGPINHNYTITGNKIYDNGWDGIRLDLEGTYWNPIFESEPSDWSCYDGSENIAAHFNNIYDNVGYGVQVIGTPTNDFVLDATNNWWGTKAKGLIKGMVSGSVDYDPWIGAKAKNSKSKKTKTDDDTVDATTEAHTKVVKKGKGKPTITVTEYTDNPGDGAPGGFTSAGKYIDVHIDDPEGVDEIEIRNYYTEADITGLDEASLRLSWWNGTIWEECSHSGVNTADTDGYSGYVWAIIRETGTIPTLADMAGTPFMSMGTPAVAPTPPPVAGGGGGGPPPAPTGTTDVRGMVTTAGVFTRDTSPTSKDGLCTLTIPKGTVGLTEELEPLTEITMLIMDEPPAPPEDAHIVGLAYDFGPDGASFDPAITLTWSYDPADIPEGIAEEDLVIVYYDEDAGRWVDLDCVVDTVNNTITAPVSHFTTFATIGAVPLPPPPPAPAPAAFSALDLSIQPAEVQPKEAVTITVSVSNTGGTQGSYSVVLMINGVKEVEKSVTVAAGESQDVSFSVTREEAASYSVVVDGLSGSFTVVTPPTPALVPAPAPPPAKPINWPLIGGIIAAVVAGFVIFFLIRRKVA